MFHIVSYRGMRSYGWLSYALHRVLTAIVLF